MTCTIRFKMSSKTDTALMKYLSWLSDIRKIHYEQFGSVTIN